MCYHQMTSCARRHHILVINFSTPSTDCIFLIHEFWLADLFIVLSTVLHLPYPYSIRSLFAIAIAIMSAPVSPCCTLCIHVLFSNERRSHKWPTGIFHSLPIFVITLPFCFPSLLPIHCTECSIVVSLLKHLPLHDGSFIPAGKWTWFL